MDETRYTEIDYHKLLKPEFFETLPAHRALAYYNKRIRSLHERHARCGSSGELESYLQEIKRILDSKAHVE